MNRTLSQLKQDGCCTIGVCYEGSAKVYTYLSNREYKPGDKIIVPVRDTFCIATVNRLDPPAPMPEKIQYKWVVGPIDFSEYDKLRHIRLIGEPEPTSVEVDDDDLPF